jgi:hypothetical protein
MHRSIGQNLGTKALSVSACLSILALSGVVGAESTIKQPNAHPRYDFEAEPHLVLGWLDPPGPADGGGYGLGFRGTFELVDPGFIAGLNNTVGLGVGLDWMNYHFENCHRNPNRDWDCDDDRSRYVWIPVVMQWNFFLHDQWSVFGEPGAAIRFQSPGDDTLDPFVLYLGGRWHFADNASLTMRIGYPSTSVGVSFFL